jgi:hypothetical protein
MGGSGYVSGGGFYGGAKNVKQLEDVAKEELQKETSPPRRKVFVSFRHTDKRMIDFLRGQAKNEGSELDFIDMSLKVPFNSENAEYIKRGIRARIDQSSVTLVAVSEDTHKSEWVNWEVEESIRRGKGVVVVNISKKDSVKMPAAVEANKDKIKVVQWKHEQIMSAIDEAAEKR